MYAAVYRVLYEFHMRTRNLLARYKCGKDLAEAGKKFPCIRKEEFSSMHEILRVSVRVSSTYHFI